MTHWVCFTDSLLSSWSPSCEVLFYVGRERLYSATITSRSRSEINRRGVEPGALDYQPLIPPPPYGQQLPHSLGRTWAERRRYERLITHAMNDLEIDGAVRDVFTNDWSLEIIEEWQRFSIQLGSSWFRLD